MKNYVQRGETLTLTAPDDLSAGDVVIVGGLVGIASCDAAGGEDVETSLTGVYTLPKAAEALDEGEAVYWDVSAGNVTATATDNVAIGHAVAAVLSGAATVNVRLPG